MFLHFCLCFGNFFVRRVTFFLCKDNNIIYELKSNELPITPDVFKYILPTDKNYDLGQFLNKIVYDLANMTRSDSWNPHTRYVDLYLKVNLNF